MTVATQTAKTGALPGNDSTTVFSFSPIVIYASSEIVVTHTDASDVETTLALGASSTTYSVTVSSFPGTGSITYPASGGTPLATGASITIKRVMTLEQATNLENQGGYFPDTQETQFDKLVMIDLQQQEELDRSMKGPVTASTSISYQMPLPVAGKSIEWNGTATALIEADSPTVARAAAAASADAALVSQNAASVSAAAAAASYDSFDDRYLGAKSSDPSTDNDGASLLTGALYWNTSTNQMFAYTGSAWSAIKPTSGEQTNIDTVVADASDIGAVAGKTTEIGLLGTAAAVADLAILGTSDVVTDMNTLGTADVVTDMNTLGTADVVSDMNTLGTADAVSDMNTLAAIASDITSVAADATDIGAVAAKATEIGRLGTSAAVADLALLGTSAVVADLAILGTADVVADMAILGTSDVVTDMNTLGTADVVTDMNTLGTADVVTDMNTLGTADVVSDMNTLGTGTNVTNMATVAANVTGVNSFAERYRVSGSDPGSSLDEGDLVYNTTSNALKYYDGSAWVAITSTDVTLADATALAIALG